MILPGGRVEPREFNRPALGELLDMKELVSVLMKSIRVGGRVFHFLIDEAG